MTSTPTPAEQIDEILAKLLVDYTTGIKFPPNSAATISVPSLKLQEAKAQLSKLLITETENDLLEKSTMTGWGVVQDDMGVVNADATIEMKFETLEDAYRWLDNIKSKQRARIK